MKETKWLSEERKQDILLKKLEIGIREAKEYNHCAFSLTFFDSHINNTRELETKTFHQNVKSSIKFSITNNRLEVEIIKRDKKESLIKTNQFETERQISKLLKTLQNKLLESEPQLMQSKLFSMTQNF